MPDFSVILQAPVIRSLVQDQLLQRAFHDALYPAMLFRGDVESEEWAGNVGDNIIFSAPGLLPPNTAPLLPGQDPLPQTYGFEQWQATVQQWAGTVDTHMPTDVVALARLFYRNCQQLGLQAAQTLNRIVRNREYNAALAGQTVVTTGAGPTNTIHVQRLVGLTTARNPNLAAGSNVRFNPVSSANPLAVTVTHAGSPISRNIIAFSPDNPGDEVGPGTITLDGAAITVSARDPVVSADASFIVRVGGGQSIDSVTSADTFSFQAIRQAVARFRQENVPKFADGRYHCHLDPTSETQVFSDAEMQRLNTALPDWYMYKDLALGHILNTIFLPNVECPQPENVAPFDGVSYSSTDNFGGELFSGDTKTVGAGTGVPIHRPLFVGQGGIKEFWINSDRMTTEAGITGKIGSARVVNNGIDVNTDHISIILRGPLNRLQDKVSSLWKFLGDWSVRTDSAVGDSARYKRFLVVEHGA